MGVADARGQDAETSKTAVSVQSDTQAVLALAAAYNRVRVGAVTTWCGGGTGREGRQLTKVPSGEELG